MVGNCLRTSRGYGALQPGSQEVADKEVGQTLVYRGHGHCRPPSDYRLMAFTTLMPNLHGNHGPDDVSGCYFAVVVAVAFVFACLSLAGTGLGRQRRGCLFHPNQCLGVGGDRTGDHEAHQSASQPIAGHWTRRVEGECVHRRLLPHDGFSVFDNREVG